MYTVLTSHLYHVEKIFVATVHQTTGGGWSLSVGRGGRSSPGVRRPAARTAVSRVGAGAFSNCSGWFGSAGWSFSAGTRRRHVVPRRVTLVPLLCVRAWPHSIGGIQTCWPCACWRARQSTRSRMASLRPLPGVATSWRALTVSLVQLSCRRYQPRGVVRALPWRVARRRSGSRMVVGVRGGSSGSRRAWRGGLPGSCTLTSMYGWPWAALAGLGVAEWPRGMTGGLWGAVGACGGGVLWWGLLAFCGALVLSWRPADGDGGRVKGAE